MNRCFTLTLAFCVLLMGTSLVMAAPKPPSDLKLAPPNGMKASKTHVAFSHAKHNAAKIECVTCHHTWDCEGNITPYATSNYHDQPGKSRGAYSQAKHSAGKNGKGNIKACATSGCHDQPGKKDARAFYTAFHAKNTDRSCLGCHKIMKKNGREVPTSCNDCHLK